jgi:CDP-glycerol glycerophosphotransferase
MTMLEKYFSKKALLGLIHLFIHALPMYVLSFFLKNKLRYSNLWLISERYNEARDSGYYLYKHIRNNYPNINCYYIIDKNSLDLPKIKPYKNIVYYGTYKHYLFYYLASRHISTHGAGYGTMANMHACRLLEKISSFNYKKIYLKHGIIKDYMSTLTKKKTSINLFVCGAYPEFLYVKENFGYDPEEVKYLGLARFDGLNNLTTATKRQIMYMPTWRTWLDGVENKTFTKSQFFEKVQSLINNKELNLLLTNNNIEFILCMHPKFLKFKKNFSSQNKNIRIVNNYDSDIQELLIESSLLITDYSSVFFDFAYMNKPLIYYQFDYENYRKLHYKEGYFNYYENGFGSVVQSESELINILHTSIFNNFTINPYYEDRINQFFPLKDNNNCERIFRSILDLK